MKLKDLLSLGDFEDAARRVLPRPIFGYAEGSVETGASLRASFAAWDDFAFLPRMLVDTTARTQKPLPGNPSGRSFVMRAHGTRPV